MEKQSKIFLLVFFGLFFSAVGLVFNRTILKQNYLIEGRAFCDPTSEKCFVHQCDVANEECTGDPEVDTVYYKLGKRKANKIPLCNPKDSDCHPFACEPQERNCQEILCDEQTLQEIEQEDECNDPVQYLQDQQTAVDNVTGTTCEPSQDGATCWNEKFPSAEADAPVAGISQE